MKPHFVDLNEFTTNGFVLIGVTFVASSFMFVTINTSMFYSVFYGMRLRSSIQVGKFQQLFEVSGRVIRHSQFRQTNHEEDVPLCGSACKESNGELLEHFVLRE